MGFQGGLKGQIINHTSVAVPLEGLAELQGDAMATGKDDESKTRDPAFKADINLQGVLNGCYLAKSYLASTPGARVINLSSTATSLRRSLRISPSFLSSKHFPT
jgi:NADP-dependent 3-hydroxy acid dehydrogenase YdfG